MRVAVLIEAPDDETSPRRFLARAREGLTMAGIYPVDVWVFYPHNDDPVGVDLHLIWEDAERGMPDTLPDIRADAQEDND